MVENINDENDIYCFPVAKDTIVFTDFNIKGYFRFNDKGEAISLQNIYQEKPMPKMKEDEFSPSEYLKQNKYAEAKEAFKSMNLNEYQITYIAYDLLNKRPANFEAVKTLLDMEQEQHPNSSIVYSRWGDYYLKLNDKQKAISNYEKAIELDPSDQQTKDVLSNLKKE